MASLALLPAAALAGPSQTRSHVSAVAAHKSHTSRQASKASADSRVCRYCGMKMSTLPNEMAPRRKRIGGKIYYCCAACGPHQVTGEMTRAMARACRVSSTHR